MTYNWSEFRSKLDQAGTLAWVDASDLSRLSRETFVGELSPVRRDHSSGMIRLLGGGVDGHSASVEAVAAAISSFQKLVISTSMAIEGHYSLRGKAPAVISEKARLNLEASPSPGSLILQFAPAHPVEREVLPGGQAEFFRSDEKMLIDNAVEKALLLLESSKSVGVVASDDQFDSQLNEVGPRVTSALRKFAKVLSDAEFETEVTWEVPRQPRVQTRMTVTHLKHLVKIVAATSKDKETTTLEGTFRTVSDVEYLRLDTDDGSKISMNAKDFPFEKIRAFRIGDRAKVSVEVEETSGAGIEPSFAYKLLDIWPA